MQLLHRKVPGLATVDLLAVKQQHQSTAPQSEQSTDAAHPEGNAAAVASLPQRN